MKALVKTKRMSGAEVKDMPKRQPGIGEVLVKVGAAAICGADIYIHDWTEQGVNFGIPIPLIFGHEMAGEIVELGPECEGFSVGDRVAVETHIPCGKCPECIEGNRHICRNIKIFGIHTNGAFSEFAVVPTSCAFKFPQSVSFQEAAVFEPFGVGVHAVTVSGLTVGDVVAVFGCGPIGLFTLMAAKRAGASMILATDGSALRRDLAKKVGANIVLDRKREDILATIKEILPEGGADVIFETSGATAALQNAFEAIRLHGKIVVVGVQPEPVPIDFYKKVICREAVVLGSYGRLMWDTWRRVVAMVSNREVDLSQVITHTMSIDDKERAFDLARRKEAGKIVFNF